MFFMSPAARSLNHLLRNVETDNLPNAPGDRNGIDAGTAAEIQNAALVSQYAGSLENLQKTVVVETCGRRFGIALRFGVPQIAMSVTDGNAIFRRKLVLNFRHFLLSAGSDVLFLRQARTADHQFHAIERRRRRFDASQLP